MEIYKLQGIKWKLETKSLTNFSKKWGKTQNKLCNSYNLIITVISRYMGDKEKVKKLNLYGGITAITTFLLFNIIYWPLVLSQI